MSIFVQRTESKIISSAMGVGMLLKWNAPMSANIQVGIQSIKYRMEVLSG